MTIKSKAFKFLLGIAVVLGVAVSASLASAADFGTATLRVGSRGAAVMEVQKVVGAKPVDGIFGPMTMAAVKAWQANNGLTPDGVVGNYTKAAMNAVSEVVAPSSGCQAGWIVNPFTNQPCGTTVTTSKPVVSGGAGDLTVTSSSKNIEDKIKEGTEENVLALKVKADDSDIEITNLKLEFKNDSKTGSEKLTDYADEVKVYLGSDEVASVDVSDFTRDSGSPDLYTKSVSLDGAIVSEGDTDYLYVAVVASSDIDTSDIKSGLLWTVTAESVRFTDGTGAIMSDSTNKAKTFGFKLASEDDDLRIKSSSANPDNTTVRVYENKSSDDILALAFKLDNDEDSSDMDLQSIKVTATTDLGAGATKAADMDKFIDSVVLKIAGEEFEAEDLTDGDVTAAGIATYTFDIDGDVTIDAGDVEEAKVYVTFYKQGDLTKTPNYGNSKTLVVSVGYAGIEAEVDGDKVDNGVSGDISGSQTGATLTVNSSAALVSNMKWDVNSTGTMIDFYFTVEAEDADFDVVALEVSDSIAEGTALVLNTSATTYETGLKGVLSKYTGNATDVGATGTKFTVFEGDKATFRVRYSLSSDGSTSVATTDNGLWLELRITSVAGQTVSESLQTSPTATVNL